LADRVPARLSAEKGRKFGLTVGLAFAVLGALVWLWRGHALTGQALGGVGVLLVMGGLAAPGSLLPVERAWMAFAHALSKVTTPIFMGIVYFLVLTPTGLLMRALGKNPLRGRASGGGLWVTRTSPRGDLERQF
jgi:hypothetical protein